MTEQIDNIDAQIIVPNMYSGRDETFCVRETRSITD